MAQSIKRGSGHANYRNREAMTLALKGRYVLQTDRLLCLSDIIMSEGLHNCYQYDEVNHNRRGEQNIGITLFC